MRPTDPEDLIRKEHALFLRKQIGGVAQESSGKVNRICDALKAEFLKNNKNNSYLLPILTVYVRK